MADPRITLTAVDRTSAAFASAKRNVEGLLASTAAISARLGPILGAVGLLGSALGALSFGNVVKGIDALNDVKDATGSSVENISALEDVAARTGTQFETVSTSLVRFNGVLKDTNPDSGPARALKAIGLSVEELRQQDPAEALRQVAVALAGFADDGDKARIVQELFGKSVKEVAPFLADLAKAGQLNAKVTTEQAEQAEKFNQQLFALEKSSLDVARALAGPVVEAFNALFASIAGGEDEFGKLSTAAEVVLVPLQALTVLGANVGFVLGGVGREIGAIAAQAAALARLDFQGYRAISDAVKEDGARARTELDDLERRVLRLRNPEVAGAAPVDGLRALRTIDNAQLKRPSVGAIPASTAGAGKAQADELKRTLDQRIQSIERNLANEQDILRFNERFVEAIYRSGSTSLETTFIAQDELRRRNVEEIRRASQETIAAEQEFQRALPKPKDAAGARDRAQAVDGSETRIQAARAKLAAAEREFEQATSLSAVQRPEQREALQQQVAQFEASLQEMVDGGRTRARELQDIAVQTRQAERLLIEGGEDPAVAQQRARAFGALLEQQRQFNLARDEFARITDRARDAEESLALAQQANGTGLLESERQIADLRARAIAQLDVLIQKTRALAAANPNDENLSDALRKMELDAARLRAVQDPTRVRFDAAADDAGSVLAEGFGRALKNVRDIRAILRDVSSQIYDIVAREIIVKPLGTGIANVLKGAGGSGTGENILTTIFGKTSVFEGGKPAPSIDLSNVFGGSGGSFTLGGGSGLMPGEHDWLDQAFGLGKAGGPFGAILGSVFGGKPVPAAAAVPSASPQAATASATSALDNLARAANGAAQALGGSPGSVKGPPIGPGDISIIDVTEAGTVSTPSAQRDILRGIEAATEIPSVAVIEESLGGLATKVDEVLPGFDDLTAGLFDAGGAIGSLPQLLNSVFGAGGGGGAGGVGDLFSLGASLFGVGFDDGGYTGPGGKFEPAGIVHKGEVVWSQKDVQAAGGPAVVEAMRLGMPGYAEGGYVDAIAPGFAAWGVSDPIANPTADPIARLERFHAGGVSDHEQLAVLLKNEEVLRASDPRHADNGGVAALNQTVNFYTQGRLTAEVQEQIAAKLGRASQAALRRHVAPA